MILWQLLFFFREWVMFWDILEWFMPRAQLPQLKVPEQTHKMLRWDYQKNVRGFYIIVILIHQRKNAIIIGCHNFFFVQTITNKLVWNSVILSWSSSVQSYIHRSSWHCQYQNHFFIVHIFGSLYEPITIHNDSKVSQKYTMQTWPSIQAEHCW